MRQENVMTVLRVLRGVSFELSDFEGDSLIKYIFGTYVNKYQ